MGVPAPSGVEALTFLEMWREASSQTWDFWWEKWDDPLCSALLCSAWMCSLTRLSSNCKPSLTHSLRGHTPHTLYSFPVHTHHSTLCLFIPAAHAQSKKGHSVYLPCSSQVSVSAAGGGTVHPPSPPKKPSWSWLWWASQAPGPGEASWDEGRCSRSYRRGWARTAAGLALGSSGRSSWRRTHYRSSCSET